ncbi:DASS family sodium-coupled anion symporter [Alistipes sp. OttesenSCG-928-B03]|nr:DASS family sodium-coupled anion symporter [Alistipes sp. OttesenSCG-928-B03]
MNKATPAFDPLDMNNYKVEKLPKIEKSGFEKWLARLGGPLAVVVFVLIYYFGDFSFLNSITADTFNPDSDGTALARLKQVGLDDFIRINYAMLAIFAAAIILWITEAVPNYLTSLIVILAMVLTQVTTDKVAYAQLGHPVMWLNILSFVLASMLVKTQVAKRFALWFVIRFGKNASWVIFSFIVINIVLSSVISATTAKATILLPIFMVIAAIYGARGGDHRNNFGRNLVLQNLFQINVGASGFLTGSGANLLAASLIAGSMGWDTFKYSDWFVVAFPLMLILIFLGWFVGMKIVFPLKKEERAPQIEGGMAHLKTELEKMGKMRPIEWRAIAIFVGVLTLWATDAFDQTAVAFIGAVVALLPGIGIVKWNDVDVPWHLMLFSAGAYTLGEGLSATGIAGTAVNASFDAMGLDASTPFWVVYMILTALMLFSALLFQSKTMRALIFIPIAIGVAQRFGYPPMSLSFPLALLIEHVYVLPFNSKPAALLYTTNQYSILDGLKYGLTMMVIAYVMILVWGETVLRWLGYTNGVFF